MDAQVIVIGNGLVGSATAKYLSGHMHTLLVGPEEPQPGQAALVYASHYDEARVQRQVGFNALWTALHRESIAAYHGLQTASGIRFHYPVGCLYVCPTRDAYLCSATSEAQALGIDHQTYNSGDELHHAFPYWQFAHGSTGYYEPTPSGYINPRLLKRAQNVVYQAHGGEVLNDTVTKVSRTAAGYAVKTVQGQTLTAPQVLVAPGSFANHHSLLPEPLELVVKGEVVVFARLSEAQAQQWQHMPTLLYEIETHELDGIYLLPPVQYPDGHFYLKIGMNMATDVYFHHLDEAQQWFRGDAHAAYLPQLRAALQNLVPSLQAESWHTKPCIISRTPGRVPHLRCVDEHGLYVAVSCNGYSAMSSDAVGRRAAEMVLAESTGLEDATLPHPIVRP